MAAPLTRREALVLPAFAFPFFWRRSPRIADVRFETLRHGRARRHLLQIHGDEFTARQAVQTYLETQDGRGFLVQSDTRLVPVEGGMIDPNRLFSRAGAERSLRQLNAGWNDEQLQRALDKLDRQREGFLRRILPPPGRLLIALHNNSRGYSVNDEVPISDRASLRYEKRPHEFLLCTDPGDYESLAKSPYNVVLQNAAPKEDDGSLSRLAAARKVRYVNIEAGLGELAIQMAMLEWVDRTLPA